MAKRKRRSTTRKKKSRQIVNAKECSYNNVAFKSKLEMYCYKAFEREGIPVEYEGETIQILESFQDPALLYKSHGKNPVREKTSNVQGIKYTPDFVDRLDNQHYGFYIEVKGRRNESFPMRLKLFRYWRKRKGINKDYFEVSSESEIEQAIEIIKENL